MLQLLLSYYRKIEFPLDNMFKTVASEISEQKGSIFRISQRTLSDSLLKELHNQGKN